MQNNQDARIQRMTGWRRALHRMPEMGLETFKTRDYLVQELKTMGYQPEIGWGETAVIVPVGPIGTRKAIAFRADMDALTVTECTCVPFASEHPGFMHACGHDGHMAALLGLADALKDRQQELQLPIVLVFQPGEEGPGGAELLVKQGLMEHFDIGSIYGFHLFPGLPEGSIGLKSGPFMAQNGEVDIRITGRSCHGAQPQQGIDAIVAAADLILRLQTVISRTVSPMDPAVLTFGRIEGGERCNIVAGEVLLQGTMRTFRDDVFKRVQDAIRSHAQGTEAAFGVTTEVTFREMYPAVTNDAALVDAISRLVEPEHRVMMEAQMLAEDFSFYQQRVPGVFFFLGTGNPEKGFESPLHSNTFNFDETVLNQAVELYLRILSDAGALGAYYD